MILVFHPNLTVIRVPSYPLKLCAITLQESGGDHGEGSEADALDGL